MLSRTPVVIIGTGVGHTPLCVSRSLGRLGAPVYAAANGFARAVVSFSRYCQGTFDWDESWPVSKSIEFLLDLGRRINQRSILIATTDNAAILVAEHAETLKKWFIFPEIDPKLVRALCSKKEMHYLAKRSGIPTPRAVFPASRREVLTFLETATLPIMVKGIDGNRLSKRCGHRMFIARSASELLEKYDSFEEPDSPNLMLQEYIPGDDQSVCGLEGYFSASSNCIFAVTGKKLRQWPAYKGVITLGTCLNNQTVENMTGEFMKAVGYQGILDIGYRYDSRDGLFKVLDINPRIGCSFRLYVSENGMDVARALYLDLTGQPVIPSAAREGRKWILEDADVLSSLRYLLDRKLTLRDWIKSFRGIQETAFFALDDPLPFVAMCLYRVTALLGRAYSTLTRRLRRGIPETRSICAPQ